ncbi:MAG: hypothetical protein JST45_12075 [Bacteroidetes bacterium]|nr:hypothetical protein [Bacteroidota bacterium]
MMKPRRALLLVATAWGAFALAQDGIRLDPSFMPELLPQTTAVRSVLPLYDGRMALIEFWQDQNNLFHNELGCLHANGVRDSTFSSLSGALDLYPWNDGAFFSWQNYSGNHINRHHVVNGAVDNGYHTATNGMPGLYAMSYLWDVNMDAEGRAYVIGMIDLLDTADGLLGPRDLIRLDQQGGMDTSFTPANTPGLMETFPLPDGHVLMGGTQWVYNDVPVEPLFLVNGDGSVDENFHTSFIEARPTSVLPLPDGGMIVTGQFVDFVSLIELDTLFVAKLLPDGTCDPSFNSNLRPYQQIHSGMYTTISSIVPWGANSYLISGNFDEVDGLPNRGIAMIDASGQLVPGACTWPGPGVPQEDGIYISLVQDGHGGVIAYGAFNGFDDGQHVSVAQGLARFVPGAVGIHEIGGKEPSVRLYPTPASSRAWLEWDPGDPLVSAVLCDGMGRALMRIPIASMTNRTALDLRGFAAGTYLVCAIHRSGVQSTVRSMVMP